MKFNATKSEVANRGAAPDAFLEELVLWGRKADPLIFAPRKDDDGETDIYTAIVGILGPWRSPEHRRAVMLEVLRVLALFESSCRWNEGRDIGNPTENNPETKSAGAFQISYNSRGFGADLRKLISAAGIQNGDQFQDHTKENHEFAMTYAASLLRHTIRHNGPVKRGEILEWLRKDAVTEFESLLAGAEGQTATPAQPVAPVGAPAGSASDLQHNDWPLEKDARAFFGYPPNLTQIECPYPMRMEIDGKWTKITRISCNLKVAPSLRRIFNAILAHYGSVEAIRAVNMDVYDGCYNDRSIAGSSKKSMHAYGAAIDMDAEHNGFHTGHGKMPKEVVAIFKAEGWRWGGDYTGRTDPMHFEACR